MAAAKSSLLLVEFLNFLIEVWLLVLLTQAHHTVSNRVVSVIPSGGVENRGVVVSDGDIVHVPLEANLEIMILGDKFEAVSVFEQGLLGVPS